MTNSIRALETECERVSLALLRIRAMLANPSVMNDFEVFQLAEVLERATIRLLKFETEADEHGNFFKIRVGDLRALLLTAHSERKYARDHILRGISYLITQEGNVPSLDTVYPQGTIVSCSDCKTELYALTKRATTVDLVTNFKAILQPLNSTIPMHVAGEPLACPKCGGRVYRDGKIHTVQEGWR